MMRKGIVVAVHPEDHSVDLVMADDGARLTGVQVVTPNGSTRTGTVDLPHFEEKEGDAKWDITEPTGQDLHAIVGYIGRNPVVTGFIYPQVNQMLSKDPKLRMTRHQSDVTQVIDGDGNIELHHPGGFYVRIGTAPDSVDLTEKNADASMKKDRNTDKKVNLRVELPGKFKLTLTPDGDMLVELDRHVNIHAKGNADIHIEGNTDIHVEGETNVQSDGQATVKAPHVTLDTPLTTMTGDAEIAGGLTVGGGAVTQGNMTVNGSTAVKDITSNDHDIGSTHRHANSGGSGPGGVPL